MKEKLKKLFTNKDFWSSIFYFFVLLFTIVLSYSFGFKDGLLLDNSVRTEFIDKINTEVLNDKNNKLDIEIGKKESADVLDSTITIPFHIVGGTCRDDTGNYAVLYANFNYTYFYEFYYVDNIPNFKIKTFSVDLNWSMAVYNDTNMNITYELLATSYGRSYSMSPNQVININEYRVLATSPIVVYDAGVFSFLTQVNHHITYDDDLSFSIYLNEEQILDLLNVYQFVFGSFIGTSRTYFSEFIGGSPSGFVCDNLNVFLTNTYILNPISYDLTYYLQNETSYNFGYDNGLSNGSVSQEQLEQAYQNGIYVGYQSGLIEGKSDFINSQEYRDTLENKYNEGYENGVDAGIQQGIEGANDSDGVFDRVFMVIRNAGASFLNLFDFYIFPNMPFYVVIAIPFIISSLFILFKILLK